MTEPTKDTIVREYGEGVTLDDVEIFSAGTWNGDAYTAADLRDMVEALDSQGFQPPVKLGHSKDQKILQADGLPAAGWVTKLRIVGDKLLATLTDVPRKIAELIKKGAYKQRSAEIFWGYRKTPDSPVQRRVLAALSFLGADIPAVKGMTPLDSYLSLYADDFEGEGELRVVETYQHQEPEDDGGIDPMPDPDKGTATAVTTEDLKKLTDQLAEFKVALDSKDEAIKKLESELTVERTTRHSEGVVNFIVRAKRDGKLAPAEEPLAKVLLESADRAAQKKYSVGETEVQGSPFELLQKFILDRPTQFDVVSHDRTSPEGERSGPDGHSYTEYDMGAGRTARFDETAAEAAQKKALSEGKTPQEAFAAYEAAGIEGGAK